MLIRAAMMPHSSCDPKIRKRLNCVPRCAVTLFVVIDDNVTDFQLKSSTEPKNTKDVVGSKGFFDFLP